MKRLISKAQLVAHVASTELGRYAINGIQFDENGAVSTDGRCLMVVPYPDALLEDYPELPGDAVASDDSPALVSLETCKQAAKGIRRYSARPILECALLESTGVNGAPGRAHIRSTDLESVQEQNTLQIEAEFPDYKSLTEGDRGECIRVTYGVLILKKILDSAKRAGGDNITLEIPAPTKKNPKRPTESSSGFKITELGDDGCVVAGVAHGAIMPVSV